MGVQGSVAVAFPWTRGIAWSISCGLVVGTVAAVAYVIEGAIRRRTFDGSTLVFAFLVSFGSDLIYGLIGGLVIGLAGILLARAVWSLGRTITIAAYADFFVAATLVVVGSVLYAGWLATGLGIGVVAFAGLAAILTEITKIFPVLRTVPPPYPPEVVT